MPSNLELRYLKLEESDHLGGFTLIELLVVTFIIGVLSAVALPSFLNQVAKARGAEAKSGLGAINRSQQAYRYEKKTFANNLSQLDIKITNKHFDFSVSSSTTNTASHQTIPQEPDLKLYSSWIEQNGDKFTQFICESNETSLAASSIMSSSSCPINYKPID